MAYAKTLQREKIIDLLSKEVLIVLGGSCFLAILSQLAIPLPFTPVPLTLQTFAVFLLAGILGSRRAVYSVLAHLVQGCCGLPVLAGGTTNPLWFAEPKAGFLFSFLAAVFLIGKLLEKRDRATLLYIALSLSLGQLAISGIGMLWLSLYFGLSKAFYFGVAPFLSGAAIKITAATLCLKGYSLCTRTISTNPKKLILRTANLLNSDGYHSGPSSNDHSLPILKKYRPPHDPSNLNHSEIVKIQEPSRA